MSRRKLLALFGIALLVAAAAAFFWSDTRAIRRQLKAMAVAGTVRADESDLERVARAARLSQLLADNVIIRKDASSFIGGRQAVVGWAMQAAQIFGPVSVAFDHEEIVVNKDATATVFMMVNVTGNNPRVAYPEPRQVHLTMSKIDGRWLLSEAEVLRIVEPARPAEGQ